VNSTTDSMVFSSGVLGACGKLIRLFTTEFC
jgi:hypothetical protein